MAPAEEASMGAQPGEWAGPWSLEPGDQGHSLVTETEEGWSRSWPGLHSSMRGQCPVRLERLHAALSVLSLELCSCLAHRARLPEWW